MRTTWVYDCRVAPTRALLACVRFVRHGIGRLYAMGVLVRGLW
jgi:hypothetical protein